MLVLLLAAIDLGRIYYAQISVANAARAGAYEASTANNPSYVAGAICSTANTVMCAVVNEAKGSAVTVAPADVSMTCTPGCSKTYGNRVSVTVQGHFTVLTPLLWVFTGGSNVTFASTAAADVVYVPGPAGGTPPTASFTATPTSGNAPLAVAVADTSTGGPTNWSWAFGDGATFVGQSPPVHTYASVGTFTITLTASNSDGSSVATHDITVSSVAPGAPVASFTAVPSSGNVPLAVTFTDTSTGTPTSWAWNFGDGQTSIAQSPPAHTYAVAGVYNVTLTVTNAGGSSLATTSINATPALPLPVPNFTFSQQNKNKPVVFVSTSTPTSPPACAINYWRWDYGDTLYDAGNFPTASHDYNQQGTHVPGHPHRDEPGGYRFDHQAGDDEMTGGALRPAPDRGQALVEFAIALPVFLMLLLGVFDLGRGVYMWNGVSQAAREIARTTSVHPGITLGACRGDSDHRRDAARARPGHGRSAHVRTTSASTSTGAPNSHAPCTSGDYVQVTVTATYTPLSLLGIGGPITLSSTQQRPDPLRR